MTIRSSKGFSLVELLVVVAIIGILAAVGITAFGGFLGSAKKNAAQSNHKAIVSSLNAEFTKCSIMGGTLKWEGSTAVSCASDVQLHQGAIVLHYLNSGFKNPYDASDTTSVIGAITTVIGKTSVFCTNAAGTALGFCQVQTIIEEGKTLTDNITKE